MDRMKKISAALIAMTMVMSMATSCGDTGSSDNSDTDNGTTTAAPAEDGAEGDAESEGDAEGEGEADADADAEGEADGGEEAGADTIPDPNFAPDYDYDGYEAFLMFGDINWLWGNWHAQGVVHSSTFDEKDPTGYGYGIDADITGDGEYTVSITKDSIAYNNGLTNPQVGIDEDTGAVLGAEGTVVFCVDIVGLMNGDGVSGLDDNGEWAANNPVKKNKLKEGDNHYDVDTIGDFNPEDITVTLTSIKADGQEVEFDPEKIRYGNIEDNNNNYRIEIFNTYGNTGKTADDYPIDPNSLVFNESLEVTFTIEGLGEVKTFPEVAPFGDGAAADTDAAAEGDVAADGEEAPAEDAAAADGEEAAE